MAVMTRKIVFAALLVTLAAFAPSAGAQADSPPQQVLEDRPVKIKKKKPHPRVAGDCLQERSGVLRVKVTFDKSGKVTAAQPIGTSGCASFDKSAVKAAFELKFEPAIKDGQPITVTKMMQYTYRFY
jgi:TonB family protein